jgi:hypothetical protein
MGRHEINWIKEPGDGKDWSWLQNIFRKLGHYYDDYVENVAEMPFNYTERSILGSLAIAADRCRYHTLLDYSTRIENGYRYPDFWITLEPRKIGYDVVFEAKRFECALATNNKKLKDGVSEKIKRIHEGILNKHGIGEAENADLQCALLAYQLRVDKRKWDKFDSNSYRQEWDRLRDELQNGPGKRNTGWVDEESICSFWYLYWVSFDKIGNLDFGKWYWRTERTRQQYLNPALGILIIGSFREVGSGV